MAGIHTSPLSTGSSLVPSPHYKQQLKRITYLSLVPLLAVGLLLAMFGLMGALPGLVRAETTATVWYAAPNGSASAACTAADPCALQTAVNTAAAGDDIHVAMGTYTPTLTVNKSITITGGYLYNAVNHTWSSSGSLDNITILDGEINHRVVEIFTDTSPALSNFRIVNGRADHGAGVKIWPGNGRAIIHNNIISGNVASGSLGGGGIYDGGGATIEQNEIYNNQGAGDGGGGVLIDNAGGSLTTTIRFNQIYSNTGTGGSSFGGGVFHRIGARGYLEANEIYGNSAAIGGGVGASVNTQVVLAGNMVYDNQATGGTPIGGGLYFAGIADAWNNTIVSNQANSGGGGLFLDGATADFSNNIVAYNTGTSGSTGIDHFGPSPEFITGTHNLIFQNTVDTALTFTNTVNANPDFVSLATFNLHLNETSPARNAGSPATPAWINIDIDGQPRPNESVQDIGADEYYPNFYSFDFTPSSTNNFVDRGQIETFAHTIENDGTLDDSYSFTCASDTFTVTYCTPGTISVNAGRTAQITTSVEIPPNLSPYDVGFTWITATSQMSPTLNNRVQVVSTIAPLPGITFTPNYSRTELPGDVITLTHYITNTGDYFDTFQVTEISDTYGWAELVPSDPVIVSMNAGGVRAIQVRIQVPNFAPQGLANVVRLEASSNFNPSVSATVVNTITAKATTGTRYVSINGNDLNNNCTQSNQPCRTVGHAVGQTAVNDEVRIAPGVYLESEIQVNDTVDISGGWQSFGDNGQGNDPNPALTVIDAQSSGQVFIIGAGAPSFSMMTVQGGRSSNGGAVFVNSPAQPSFTNIIFARNHATNRGGALFVNSGTAVSVRKSAFTNNSASVDGGGVYISGGTLSLNQTRFMTNTANSGGALAVNSGILVAQNNLFSSNNAAGSGGAVSLNSGTIQFNFNTWSANSAGGNGGGVYNGGADATIRSSIFAGNSDASAADYAIFDDGSGAISLSYLDMWQNSANVVTGTGSITGDPLFEDAEFHLGLGSPAIDAADPASTLPVDFEDDFRPSDEGFDMGYDERAGCRAMREEIVYGSIQDAVDADSTDPLILVSGVCRGVHTIDDGGATISQTVHLTQSLTIQGGWPGDFGLRDFSATVVDPEGRGRGFYVTNGVSVTIQGLTITNGSAANLGGGPAGEDAGGGVYNVDGELTLRNVAVVSSTAVLGGGFYNDSGAPLVTWEWLPGNTSNRNDDEYLLSVIAFNDADDGAGLYNNNGPMVVDGARLHHNQATNGGGLYNLTGPITVANTIVDANAASNGAGFYNEAVTSTFVLNTVYSNTAVINGGGFYNASGQPVVHSTLFVSNTATSGSAIYAPSGGTSADVDYNYYYGNNGTAVIGTVTGTHSIDDGVPPGLIDPRAGDFHLADQAPAMDQGDPNTPIPIDFEGDPRPSNQGFDIGADEILGCLVKIGDTVYGSLQEAIDNADENDVINVYGTCSGASTFDTGRVNACSGDAGIIQTAVHITKNLTILGGWDEGFNNRLGYSTIDARNQGRVVYFGPGVTTTLDGFELINGLLTGTEANGAGICIDHAAPTIRHNRIYSNTASGNGGGIYSLNSSPRIDGGNHIFSNNADAGGGLFINLESGTAPTSTVHNNFIYWNNAQVGAGVYTTRGDQSLLANTLVGNDAATFGGAFAVSGGAPDIRGSILMSNTAASGGSAIYATTTITPGYNDYYQNSAPQFSGSISDGGPGSLNVDPQFTNAVSGVFTITITSPVADITIPDLPVPVDYEGDIRPSHQGYDLGADEVGGCFAAIQGQTDTVYGSVQQAVDIAQAGDTILVDGVCRNVNTRTVNGSQVTQNLVLTKSLTIDGSWEYSEDTSTVTTTLDAINRGRVVYIANGATVTLTNILLTNGDATVAGNGSNGGGVFNRGTLYLVDAWVQENTAVSGGGLYNTGDLTVRGSSILTNTAQQDGGGIYNITGGLADIGGSTIRNNRIGHSGGGVYHQSGTLTLNANRIHLNGYPTLTGAGGGGVYLTGNGRIDVRNNFIYLNQSETGGGIYDTTTFTDTRIYHNTFIFNTATSGDGGGVAIVGAANRSDIQNNVVDSNNGSGVYIPSGSPTLNYNNVTFNTGGDYDSVVAVGAGSISQPPDYVDRYAENFHLRSGSPGEDVGNSAISAITNTHAVRDDIDGDMRPTNGGPDMGADEINSCLVEVNGQVFGVLQDAIDYAESGNYHTLRMARGECRGVLTRDGTEQVARISENLEFIGSLRRSDFSDPDDYYNVAVGTVSSIINAAGEGRAVYIASTATVSFTHIAFVNGDAFATDASSDNGGALYNDGGRANFFETYLCNSVAQNGGGYYGTNPSLTDMTGVTIGSCIPARVTENENGEVTDVEYLWDFGGNQANQNGGGIYFAGETDLRNMIFRRNAAGASGAGNGGGVYNAYADNRIVNGIFYQNIAADDGGGVYNSGSSFQLLHNTIRNNQAGDQGSGIYNSGSGFILNSSIIFTNTAATAGGGLFSTQAPATLMRNNFHDNAPDNTNVGTGTEPIIGDPGLRGFHLSVNSRNIDAADPSLLPVVDFDAGMEYRPDGHDDYDYRPPHGLYADVGADEYVMDFGCKIEPESDSLTAAPGETLTYTVYVINTGNPPYTDIDDYWNSHGYTDTITVTVDSRTMNWSELQGGDEQLLTLGWQDTYPYGEQMPRILTVTVPTTATVGMVEVIDMRCQSGSLPARQGTSRISIEVGAVSGVLVTPDYVDTAVPGEVLTYTHTVLNTGNEATEFEIIPSSGPRHANATLLDRDTLLPISRTIVTLAAQQSITTLLRVNILDTATAGDVATPGVVARATADPLNYGAALDRITILPGPGTRYVAASGASDNTNCTDPLNPCATIQHAIDQALDDDDILIAAGSYTDYTTRTVGADTLQQNIFIDKSITIMGGFSTTDLYATRQPITNAVTLNGQGQRRVVYVADGVTTTLSSLFIQNGNAAPFGSMNGSTRDYGGGIYQVNGSLTITGTWVLTSSARYGGGLYFGGGLLNLNNSAFAGNSNSNPADVAGEGGGLFINGGAANLQNNSFVNNQANPGDGGAVVYGGAIYQAGGSMNLVNHIFQDNQPDFRNVVYISSTAAITNAYNLYFNQLDPITGGTGPGSITGQDPLFIDPFYHISGSSPAKDRGTMSLTYVTPELLAGGDFDLEARVQGPGIDMGADERTQRPGFLFTPAVLSATIDSGTVFTYTHYLTNTGDFTDTYTLSLANLVVPAGDATWGSSFSPQTITDLTPGSGVTVTLVVTGGQVGYYQVSTLTAVSDSGLSADVEDTTYINQIAGVDIEPSSAAVGLPGQLITYSHTLTNTGNGLDAFTLSAVSAPANWAVTLTPTQTGYLNPLQSIPFTVTVQIPANAISGTVHQITVTAEADNPYASDVLTDVTTVGLVSGLTLTPDYTRTVTSGSTTIYTHTLSSSSNITDAVSLAVTGVPGSWAVSVNPTAVTLAPYESRTISVSVTVPLNTGGMTHTAHVTATSSLPALTAAAVDTTTVPIDAGMMFFPDHSRIVNAGTTQTYTHTLVNTGNLTDTFALSSASVQGWAYSVSSGDLTLAPFASVQVTAVLTIPTGITPGTVDYLWITATSQANSAVTGLVTDTTRIIQRHELAFFPDRSATVDAGTTHVYSHTLANNGDGVDSFDLTYSGSPAWPVTLPPTPIVLNAGTAVSVPITVTIPSGASGLMNVTVITATSTISTVHSAAVTDTTTVSGTQAILDVVIAPNHFSFASPNETLTYTHIVTNPGSGPDDIGLSLVSNWATTITPTMMTLASGASAPVTVTVTVPAAPAPGTEDVMTVTAVSLSDPSISDAAINTTRVRQFHNLAFYPDRAQTANAGSSVVYTHTLRNDGDAEDMFAIAPDSVWTAVVNSPVTLNPGESATIYVTLTVPAGTEGQTNVMTVTARSEISPTVSAYVTDTTTVSGTLPGAVIDIEPDYTDYGVPGDTLQYVHTVTNNGDAADTFDVTVSSSARWAPAVTPSAVALGPHSTALVTVTITIPAGASLGDRDVTTVRVTSQTDPAITDFALDTTTVPGVFLPIIINPDEDTPPTPTPTPTTTSTPTPGPTPTHTPTPSPTPCSPTGKDLVVTEIRVEPASPASGVPATVYVTIRNQGSVDVAYGNNFYLDFYVDRVPARYLVGEIEWGVQGVLMQAGHSETFSAPWTFSGGSHDLWAQVDTDNTVDECPFEDNNVLGPVPLTVTGLSGVDEERPFVPPENEPRHTPTPEVRRRPLATPTPPPRD